MVKFDVNSLLKKIVRFKAGSKLADTGN